MSRPIRSTTLLSACAALAVLCLPAVGRAAIHGAAPQTGASAPDSAPDSEVSSGERVTGHTHTRKSRNVKTSPEQPAPATRQRVQPSQRLPDEPNQEKEQVAPMPDAPVKPGTTVHPGNDTPKPQRR